MDLRVIAPLTTLGIIVVVAVTWMTSNSIPENTIVLDASIESSNLIDENPKSTPTIMETDGQKHIISLDKIKSGGPPKDGIPSIDFPKFAEVSDSQFVSDSDVVIGLEINGDTRAYPLFILVWHEIVNDNVGGVPVAITYCPLCYTNQVFERIIQGNEVEFGTSGKLFQSNLLMYDRWTDSYWSQGLGMAVTGELSGIKLKTIPFDVITWE